MMMVEIVEIKFEGFGAVKNRVKPSNVLAYGNSAVGGKLLTWMLPSVLFTTLNMNAVVGSQVDGSALHGMGLTSADPSAALNST